MIKGQVTQLEIAKKLNVSRVTVSKALRDHPDISEEMKKRVSDLVKRMGYVPNMIARQLNSRKTSTIGIVVPDLENSFFAYVVDSMIDFATENDYRAILTVSREKEKVEKRNIENLIGMRVDGLLVCISQETKDKAIFSLIKRMKIPLVFFDRVIRDSGFSGVVFDDWKGAVTALDKVIDEGYRKIAHFAGYSAINIGMERLEGYKFALKKHGIPLKKEWIIEGGYELRDGYVSFNKLKALIGLPEIIFTVNDRVALGTYMAAREAGLKIPADIGIMGFGFRETTDIFNPSLAVINQDPRRMGRISAEKLLNEIAKTRKQKPSTIFLEEEFLWNKSLKRLNIKNQ